MVNIMMFLSHNIWTIYYIKTDLLLYIGLSMLYTYNGRKNIYR